MTTGTETRILEAAIELFAEHGYAASARKIAARADSTTMTLYRAFHNKKEHLFTEALAAPRGGRNSRGDSGPPGFNLLRREMLQPLI